MVEIKILCDPQTGSVQCQGPPNRMLIHHMLDEAHRKFNALFEAEDIKGAEHPILIPRPGLTVAR